MKNKTFFVKLCALFVVVMCFAMGTGLGYYAVSIETNMVGRIAFAIFSIGFAVFMVFAWNTFDMVNDENVDEFF